MNWTTTPPTEPGWYWWRDSKSKEAQPLNVYKNSDGNFRVYVNLFGFGSDRYMPSRIGGEWWPIPIEEPKP